MKILYYDIENSPSLGYFYDLWKEGNIVWTKNDWYMLSFAYKWQGGKMKHWALPDFKDYKPGSENDKRLVRELWKLFNEADITIAHNGDRFDRRKANARFAYWGLPPPAPYKTVDTLKVARSQFYFTSNKLDDLAKYFGFGGKMVHTGFDLWKRCMAGDLKAWSKMVKYNRRDVVLLEKIYLRLRPWIKNHANVTVMDERKVCPKCGSTKIQFRGFYTNATTMYRRIQCMSCKGWARSTHNLKKTKPFVNV